MWIVYRHYDINEEAGVVYDLRGLMSVEWAGDDRMEWFLDQWTAVLSGLHEQPTPETREHLFVDQLRKSTALREEVSHYYRCEKGAPDRSYEFLMRQMRRHIEQKRQRRNREEFVRALGGKAGTAAPAVAADQAPMFFVGCGVV